MSRARHLVLALALGACCLAPAACGDAGGGGAPGRGSSAQSAALVTGTALDAASGELLAGVRIEGPRGTRAVSGPKGRFTLEGLVAGDAGEVVGRLDDGRTGRLRLRPLGPGRLEVVLRLERP